MEIHAAGADRLIGSRVPAGPVRHRRRAVTDDRRQLPAQPVDPPGVCTHRQIARPKRHAPGLLDCAFDRENAERGAACRLGDRHRVRRGSRPALDERLDGDRRHHSRLAWPISRRERAQTWAPAPAAIATAERGGPVETAITRPRRSFLRESHPPGGGRAGRLKRGLRRIQSDQIRGLRPAGAPALRCAGWRVPRLAHGARRGRAPAWRRPPFVDESAPQRLWDGRPPARRDQAGSAIVRSPAVRPGRRDRRRWPVAGRHRPRAWQTGGRDVAGQATLYGPWRPALPAPRGPLKCTAKPSLSRIQTAPPVVPRPGACRAPCEPGVDARRGPATPVPLTPSVMIRAADQRPARRLGRHQR